MESFNPNSLNQNQTPENTFSTSPKILEYVERVKKGESIESFGDIPSSWKNEIIKQTTTSSNEEIVSNEVEQPIENKSTVNQKLKTYLLSRVNVMFTKDMARSIAKNNIEKASDKELYIIALEQFYRDARTTTIDYDRTSPLFDFDVEQKTMNPNDYIKRVQDENGWHYRIAKTGTTANKSDVRISLNVWGNNDLVDRLDKIAYKYGIYYKTPAQSDSWNERNDPVTIYINNPNLTPEHIEMLKQEVVAETKPYIRSNEGFGIYGDNISEGVEFGHESSVEEIRRLKDEARVISEDLYEAFDEYLRREGKEKSSVGMNLAAQKLLNEFKEI